MSNYCLLAENSYIKMVSNGQLSAATITIAICSEITVFVHYFYYFVIFLMYGQIFDVKAFYSEVMSVLLCHSCSMNDDQIIFF